MGMTVALVAMMVSWVHLSAGSGVVQIKYVQLFTCQSCFNKMVKYIRTYMQTDKVRGKKGEIHPLNGSIKWETDIVYREIVYVEFLKHTTTLRWVILIIIN